MCKNKHQSAVHVLCIPPVAGKAAKTQLLDIENEEVEGGPQDALLASKVVYNQEAHAALGSPLRAATIFPHLGCTQWTHQIP